MKYDNIIIRDKKQIDELSKKNKDLYDAIEYEVCEREPKPESYPLVYQYKQGKPGETVTDGKSSDVIGSVSNLLIDNDGNLVATVIIGDMYAKANQFQSTVDNFVFKKDIIKTGKRELSRTKLVHFIVYDKVKKEEDAKKREWAQKSQKLYNAPTEDYGAPREGGRAVQFKETCDKLLGECTKTNPLAHSILTNPSLLQREKKGENYESK